MSVQVDTLITNGTILMMDSEFTMISDGILAIKDKTIVHVGNSEGAQAFEASEQIDANGGIILPGFINTHCHAAMSLFRGLADDTKLDQFLKTVWAAEAAHITHDTVFAGTQLSVAEMALGGVTHFLDMYWHVDATIEAAKSIGVGITCGPAMLVNPATNWDECIEGVRTFFDRYDGDDFVNRMLVPHSCYTLDQDKLKQIAALSAEFDCGVHTHASEAAWELDLVQAAYGTTPIRALAEAGLLDRPLLLAHAVHLDDEEIAMLSDANAAVSHCPASNAKLASGTARVRDLLDAGVTLSLGTDGPSSGNDLDMFKAMRLMSFMHNLRTRTSDTLPARDVVAAATIGGAHSLGLGDKQGSLEVGKQADITIVGVSNPHMVPVYDPYSSLVYSAGREDVSHVLAHGKTIVANGNLVQPTAQIISNVRTLASSIQGENAQ